MSVPRHYDRFDVFVDGEDVEVFNQVTVRQEHEIRADETATQTLSIEAGDGGIGKPEAVTTWVAEWLWDDYFIDPEDYDIDVIDVTDDEVHIR
jgi:hypothetical protein